MTAEATIPDAVIPAKAGIHSDALSSRHSRESGNPKSFARYPEYKDSGVAWLGEVPAHWTKAKVKHVCSFTTGWTPPTGDSDSYVGDNLWANISDLGPKVLVDCAKRISDEAVRGSSIALSPSGSLLFSFKLSIGQVSFAGVDMYTNEAIATFRANSAIALDFAYYAFPLYVVQNAAENIYGAKLLNQELIRNAQLPLPNSNEQQAIAAFLDRETGKIDALIAEQEKLIVLLKEKRQALISHAVTKGLDPNAPMKDSDIEWLGQIPAHWELLPTKRLFKVIVDPAPDDNDFELLSIYTDIGVRPRKELEAKGNKATTTDGYFRVAKGDLIVNKLLAWMGAIGVSRYDGVTSPAYDILRAARPLEPEFYDYLFRCGILFCEFRRFSRGIMDMRLRLYFDQLGQMKMPFPPEEEQRQIVNWIDERGGALDNLVCEALQAIALLKERRAALISAAVTGKIDVRDKAASNKQDEARAVAGLMSHGA